jgi:hypothetical protein
MSGTPTLTSIYGLKIYLKDFVSPVAQNTSIGLYNRIATLSQALTGNTYKLNTLNVSAFELNESVFITGGGKSEINWISSISPTQGALYLANTSMNTYPVNTSQVQANSQFRWTQNDVLAPAESWKSGVLMQNGIGTFSRKIDLRRMGNTATPGDCTAQVNNTNLFFKTVRDSGIYFNGLVAKVIKFTNNIESSRWMGECQKPSWTSKRYIIPIKGIYNKRISSCTTVINNDPISGNFPNASDDKNGTVIPITIGNFKINSDGNPSCAKFLRISDAELTIVNSGDVTQYPANQVFACQSITPTDQSVFPIVNQVGTPPGIVTYQVQMGISVGASGGLNLTGTWMKVVLGGAADGTSLVGKYRKVLSCAWNYGTCVVQVTLDSCYEQDLTGDPTVALNTNNAWVSFVSVNYQFYGDMWPLYGFYDSLGSLRKSGLSLYAYNSTLDTRNFLRVQLYNAQGTAIPNGINKEKQVGFQLVSQFGYSILNITNNNIIIINPFMMDGGPNTLISFDIFPLKRGSFSRLQVGNLDAYGMLGYTNLSFGGFLSNVYCLATASANLTSYVISSNPVNTSDTMFDQDDSSYEQHHRLITNNSGGVNTVFTVFETQIDFSLIKKEYDSYFLGINIASGNLSGATQSPILISFRRFMGLQTKIVDNLGIGVKFDDHGVGTVNSFINDLPDFYYTNRTTPDNNLAFMQVPLSTLTNIVNFTGYKTFPLNGINSLILLNSIYRIGIFLGSSMAGGFVNFNATAQVKELAIICQSSDNISDEIYTLCGGRVWALNSVGAQWNGQTTNIISRSQTPPTVPKTWPYIYWVLPGATGAWAGHDNQGAYFWSGVWSFITPVTNTGVFIISENASFIWDGSTLVPNQYYQIIQDPVSALEHFCRLQNGSENSPAPYAGWGKAYWNNALINMNSFYDSGMAALRNYQCAGQIHDEKDGFTSTIKKKLCYQFGMASYTDGDGYECVKPLLKALTSPSDTITLSQIIDRNSIKVYEPDPADIYPEPFVQYNKNYGSGAFDGLIKIMNTDFENPSQTQKGLFVQGCQNGDVAATLWGLCYNLMQRTHNMEPPPSDMTDLDFIRDYSTALAHLTDWINWMYNPEIEFNVSSVATGADAWQECHRFNLILPHQTANVNIECILEEITVNPNAEHEVKIKAIMLSDTIPQGFNFTDSIQAGATGWQDSIQSGAQGEQAIIS